MRSSHVVVGFRGCIMRNTLGDGSWWSQASIEALSWWSIVPHLRGMVDRRLRCVLRGGIILRRMASNGLVGRRSPRVGYRAGTQFVGRCTLHIEGVNGFVFAGSA